MNQTTVPNQPPEPSLMYRLSQTWMLWFSLLFGLYVGLPFLAPLLMQIGAELPARMIYGIYAFMCHQLPERSFFLFGEKTSYSIPEIAAVWHNVDNPMVLRQFVGNPEMGWKVAWSDRMVSMYGATLLFAWLWWPLRSKVRPLHWLGLVLLLLPMALDGSTHFISDLAGLHNGFRYTNDWLVALTGGVFPADFYAGDAIGSFNSWMRLISGFFFGLGVVWAGLPIVHALFQREARDYQAGQHIQNPYRQTE